MITQWRRIIRPVAVLFAGLALFSCSKGAPVNGFPSQEGTPGRVVEMDVMSAADYDALTGCEAGMWYVEAMTTALQYLMFGDPPEEMGELDGGFEDRCWTEGLRRMNSASHHR